MIPRTTRGKSKGGIRPMHGQQSVAEVRRYLVAKLQHSTLNYVLYTSDSLGANGD
jgi:hypothetical protein